MKEFKVRGWHVSQQKMFSCEQMVADQLTLLTDGRFINVHGNNPQLSKIFSLDEFIPLLYTGLKDKNGNEIYEGDVIDSWAFPNGESRQYLRTIVEDPKTHQLVLEPLTGFILCEPACSEHFEIIGNIYENPELIES